MDLQEIIQSARGDKQVDLLLTNAQIVDVFSGQVSPGQIAVQNGYIVGLGTYSAQNTIDLKGRYVAPGFIDAHVHIESSMACITEFVRTVLARGTTTVVADPHEIANVLGFNGIGCMLESSKHQPMNIYFTLPSCVPATDMETSGARLTSEDLRPLMDHDRILALAEMMNFPGVIQTDPEVLMKIEMAKKARKPVDGHAPGLSGTYLNAYLAAGISSDHECTTAREAKEKLTAGMVIMIRESTGAKNLDPLLPLVNARTYRRMMWCTDDRHPHDLLEEGHIDFIVRSAIGKGLDPVIAIQMATINPAEYFAIKDAGAIAPGRKADLLIVSDLAGLHIDQVYCHGTLMAENGKISTEVERPASVQVPTSMTVRPGEIDFSVKAKGRHIRVIDIIADQLITRERIMEASVSDTLALTDVTRDLLKIAVVERHTGSGNVATGFVSGFGLKQGALASSVAHDSHNIVIVGENDADMKAALAAVVEMKGGLAAVCDREVRATLPLPVAGLMSLEPIVAVRKKLDKLIRVAREFGSNLNDPFMTLSFLALPVIPDLKITDLGLVNVKQFSIVPLFTD
jgi:adenine deaminase